MATTQLKGNPVTLSGDFPVKDAPAKNFTAVQQDLSLVSLDEFKGKRVTLNIFPRISTGVSTIKHERIQSVSWLFHIKMLHGESR